MFKRIEAKLNAISDKVNAAVGTPWCTLLFTAISVAATPGVFPALVTTIAQWVATAFLQLVLLAVLQTGQNRSAEKLEGVIMETHDTVLSEFAEVKAMHAELASRVGSKTAEDRDNAENRVTDAVN